MTDQDLNQWMLVFLRMTAFLTVFPLVSMGNIPIRVRVALGAMASFLIVPTLGPSEMPPQLGGVVGIMAKEVGAGLILGFVTRMLFFIVEFAGSMISMEMGLNMATTLSPLSQSRSDLPATFLYYLSIVLFMSLDLHHMLLVGFQRSYEVLPIGAVQLSDALFEDMVHRTSRIFVVGLLMSAPIIAVAFIINLVFSILGRAVPQMNIFIESFAFRILAGLVVFGMTLNLMAQHIVNYLKALPNDLILVAQMLGGG